MLDEKFLAPAKMPRKHWVTADARRRAIERARRSVLEFLLRLFRHQCFRDKPAHDVQTGTMGDMMTCRDTSGYRRTSTDRERHLSFFAFGFTVQALTPPTPSSCLFVLIVSVLTQSGRPCPSSKGLNPPLLIHGVDAAVVRFCFFSAVSTRELCSLQCHGVDADDRGGVTARALCST